VLLAARNQNMPKDNVDRAIKKGTGDLPGVTYDEITYEGYAAGGVAIVVEVLTDNKNRVVAEIRHLLVKNGGSMAETGAVTWNFEKQGHIAIPKSACSEEDIFEKAIEAGAEDVDTEGDRYEITTAPTDLHAVADALERAGLALEEVGLTMVPKNTLAVEGKEAAAVLRLLEALEDNEDVQNVYANFDISEEEMAAVFSD